MFVHFEITFGMVFVCLSALLYNNINIDEKMWKNAENVRNKKKKGTAFYFVVSVTPISP